MEKIFRKKEAVVILEGIKEKVVFLYPAKGYGNFRWGGIEKTGALFLLRIWNFDQEEYSREGATLEEAVKFLWKHRKYFNRCNMIH